MRTRRATRLAVVSAVAILSLVATISESPAAHAAAAPPGTVLILNGGGIVGPSWGCGLTGQHRICVFATSTGMTFANGGFGSDEYLAYIYPNDGLVGSPNYISVACNIDDSGTCTTSVPLPSGTYNVLLQSSTLGFGVANIPDLQVTLPGSYSLPVSQPLPIDETPSTHSVVEAAADGGVFTFGGARYFGSMAEHPLNRPVVGIATTPHTAGYWLVASDGGIFSFGDANFYGSMGGKALNEPIVGMAATPDGGGYWEVASDGGVFSFGDAGFYGSTGGITLDKPIVGIAATPDGKGYWLVAADGGVFAFGDAEFYGSASGTVIAKPIVGIAPTPDGHGYWLVGGDGGIFAYGDAPYCGSGTVDSSGSGGVPQIPFAGIADLSDGGYALAFSNGIGYTDFDPHQVWDEEGFGAMLGVPNQPIVGIAGH